MWADERGQLLSSASHLLGCYLAFFHCLSHHPPSWALCCGLEAGDVQRSRTPRLGGNRGQPVLSLGILQSGEVSSLSKSLKETPGCSRAVLSQPK